MAEIVNMKQKPSGGSEVAAPMSQKESYHYGLRITLNDDALDKLGCDFKKFNTDTPVKLTCEAIVVSKSESEYDGKVERRLELQITGLSKPAVISENRMKTGTDLLKKMRGSNY